jgi:hypothetical protein
LPSHHRLSPPPPSRSPARSTPSPPSLISTKVEADRRLLEAEQVHATLRADAADKEKWLEQMSAKMEEKGTYSTVFACFSCWCYYQYGFDHA